MEAEIQRLTAIRHPNLVSVFAVKLHMPHSSGSPQLMVLSEQAPALTLHDVLEDCDSLREERAMVGVLLVVCTCNSVVSSLGLSRSDSCSSECTSCRRFGTSRSVSPKGKMPPDCCLDLIQSFNPVGINTRCIGLASRDHPTQSKLIKLGKVCFHTRLLDLHRSNSFGANISVSSEDPLISDAWWVPASH